MEENTLRYQDAKLWTTLSNEFKNTSSKECFKQIIFSWPGPMSHNCGDCVVYKLN
jgi:hypothetical protein